MACFGWTGVPKRVVLHAGLIQIVRHFSTDFSKGLTCLKGSTRHMG